MDYAACCKVCVTFEIVGGPGSGTFSVTLEGSLEDVWDIEYDYDEGIPSWSFYITRDGVRVHGPVVVTEFLDTYTITSISNGKCL